MNILIIGKNSYIGNHMDKWLTGKGHQVEQLDVQTDEWKTYDYSPYDAIVHVAGIVHRPNCNDWELYRRVNTEMPIAIATKFRDENLKLRNGRKCTYVFFSTMGVYDAGKALDASVVDENSPLLISGNSMYAKSKALSEQGLMALESESKESSTGFNIAIVRPPSVYGKGCKGGYITGFMSIVRYLPVIPRAYLNARQSFIYIDNLCECVRLIVENHLNGLFCPQDDEIPNANELFEAIADGLGKKYHDSRLLGLLMQLVSFIPLVKKAYGGIEYSRKLSDIPGYNYVVVSFREGIRRTVSK